jgi:hypothetical protein
MIYVLDCEADIIFQCVINSLVFSAQKFPPIKDPLLTLCLPSITRKFAPRGVTHSSRGRGDAHYYQVSDNCINCVFVAIKHEAIGILTPWPCAERWA